MAVVTYCTREMVQRELGFSDTVRLNTRVDRACRAGARDLEALCHRVFYPTTDARSFDLPVGGTLWLYEHELAGTPTSIVTGGTTLTTADYILQPESGPPYRWIDINTSGATSWQSGNTPQDSTVITGPYGGSADTEPAGATAASVATASTTTMDVTDSTLIGVGDLLTVESERMIVTGKTYITTGVTTSGSDLTANKAGVSVPVSSGAGIIAGETILIDSERMFVESVAGNTLTVTRAEQGTVLAAHTSGATVYAPRRLTVTRGATGTTAATHTTVGTAITRNLPPALIAEGNMALAVNFLQQGSAGYAASLGTGNRRNPSGNQRDAPGGALQELMERIYTAHGRKTRSRAVM